MDFEFDKEMDAILRQAPRDDGSVFDSHPDADEIAAFAARAVPPAAVSRLTSHFADCPRCRFILASSFEPEPELQTATVPVITESATMPWYRRFLVFPGLAYSLGAITLVFGGMFAYVALRNLPENGTVAMQSEKPAISSAPLETANRSFPDVMNSANSTSAANSAVAPNAGNTSTAVSPETPVSSSNSTVTTAVPRGTVAAPNAATVAPSPALPVSEPSGGEIAERDDTPVRPAATDETRMTTQNGGALLGRNEEALKSLPPAAPKAREKEDVAADLGRSTRDQAPTEAKKKRAVTEKTIGGRVFRNNNGVWTDSNFRSQPITDVRRGSDEYRQLESGVRNAAEQLSGTVIVVAGSRAFRIN